MTRKIDHTGERHGRLIVLEEDVVRGNRNQVKWICRCDCGSLTSVLVDNLRGKRTTKSCGCLLLDAAPNMVGKDFGDLRVIKRSGKKTKGRSAYWDCLCACGKIVAVKGRCLRSRNTTSCGYCVWLAIPIRRTGASSHYLYSTWRGMVSRCLNKHHPDFHYYGGQGIKVLDEWRDPFIFFRWIEENLGPRPEGHSLDRINVYGHYEPGNLRWASDEEQVNNRRLVLLSEEEYAVIMEMRADLARLADGARSAKPRRKNAA